LCAGARGAGARTCALSLPAASADLARRPALCARPAARSVPPARQPPSLWQFRGTGPRRVRRRVNAPGPALRHGLHHRDASPRIAAGGWPPRRNDPASVRNAPEKLFVLHFKELMPPTLLTLDTAEI